VRRLRPSAVVPARLLLESVSSARSPLGPVLRAFRVEGLF
jgi:hypothetical protein